MCVCVRVRARLDFFHLYSLMTDPSEQSKEVLLVSDTILWLPSHYEDFFPSAGIQHKPRGSIAIQHVTTTILSLL